MRINTKKIEKEMERLGLNHKTLGEKFKPPRSRQSVWFLIHRSKTFRPIVELAKALDLDPKDLII